MVKGVLKGGEIPPLNKIYKRIDEIAPVFPSPVRMQMQQLLQLNAAPSIVVEPTTSSLPNNTHHQDGGSFQQYI